MFKTGKQESYGKAEVLLCRRKSGEIKHTKGDTDIHEKLIEKISFSRYHMS